VFDGVQVFFDISGKKKRYTPRLEDCMATEYNTPFSMDRLRQFGMKIKPFESLSVSVRQ